MPETVQKFVLPGLQRIRESYPEYKDRDDIALMGALRKKFSEYSDYSDQDFDKAIVSEFEVANRPAPKQPVFDSQVSYPGLQAIRTAYPEYGDKQDAELMGALRKKYPEYNSRSDIELDGALFKKFGTPNNPVPESGIPEENVSEEIPEYLKTRSGDTTLGFTEELEDQWLTEKALTKIPFMGHVLAASKLMHVRGAADRLEAFTEDKQTYDKFSNQSARPYMVRGSGRSVPQWITPQKIDLETDRKTLSDFVIQMEKDARKRTLGGKIAQGVSALPTYMAEMGLTNAVAKFGTTAAKAAMKRILKKQVEKGLGKLVTKGVEWGAAAVTRSTVGLLPTATETAAQRQAEVAIGKRKDESPLKSAFMGWLDTVAMSAGESSGEALSKVGNLLPKKIMSTEIGKKVFPTLLKRWVATTGKTEKAFWGKLMEKGGFSGIIPEMGEEYVESTLKAALGTEDFGVPEGSSRLASIVAGVKQLSDPETLAATGVTLLVPGAVAKGSSMMATRRAVNQSVKKMANDLKEAGYSERRIKETLPALKKSLMDMVKNPENTAPEAESTTTESEQIVQPQVDQKQLVALREKYSPALTQIDNLGSPEEMDHWLDNKIQTEYEGSWDKFESSEEFEAIDDKYNEKFAQLNNLVAEPLAEIPAEQPVEPVTETLAVEPTVESPVSPKLPGMEEFTPEQTATFEKVAKDNNLEIIGGSRGDGDIPAYIHFNELDVSGGTTFMVEGNSTEQHIVDEANRVRGNFINAYKQSIAGFKTLEDADKWFKTRAGFFGGVNAFEKSEGYFAIKEDFTAKINELAKEEASSVKPEPIIPNVQKPQAITPVKDRTFDELNALSDSDLKSEGIDLSSKQAVNSTGTFFSSRSIDTESNDKSVAIDDPVENPKVFRSRRAFSDFLKKHLPVIKRDTTFTFDEQQKLAEKIASKLLKEGFDSIYIPASKGNKGELIKLDQFGKEKVKPKTGKQHIETYRNIVFGLGGLKADGDLPGEVKSYAKGLLRKNGRSIGQMAVRIEEMGYPINGPDELLEVLAANAETPPLSAYHMDAVTHRGQQEQQAEYDAMISEMTPKEQATLKRVTAGTPKTIDEIVNGTEPAIKMENPAQKRNSVKRLETDLAVLQGIKIKLPLIDEAISTIKKELKRRLGKKTSSTKLKTVSSMSDAELKTESGKFDKKIKNETVRLKKVSPESISTSGGGISLLNESDAIRSAEVNDELARRQKINTPEAKVRVILKRKLRKAGIKFNKESPTEELESLLTSSADADAFIEQSGANQENQPVKAKKEIEALEKIDTTGNDYQDKPVTPLTEAETAVLKGTATPAQVEEAFAGNPRVSVLAAMTMKQPPRMSHLIGLKIENSNDFGSLMVMLKNPYFETLKVVCLDKHGQVISAQVVAVGNVKHINVSIGNIRKAVPMGTVSVYLAHNHPSGNPAPSKTDIDFAETMKEYFAKKNIEMKDSISTDGDSFYSYSDGKVLTLKKASIHPAERMNRGLLPRVATDNDLHAMISMLRQGDKKAFHVILLDTKLKVIAVERRPIGMTHKEFKSMINSLLSHGGNRVIIDFNNMNNNKALAFKGIVKNEGGDILTTVIGNKQTASRSFKTIKDKLSVRENPTQGEFFNRNIETDYNKGVRVERERQKLKAKQLKEKLKNKTFTIDIRRDLLIDYVRKFVPDKYQGYFLRRAKNITSTSQLIRALNSADKKGQQMRASDYSKQAKERLKKKKALIVKKTKTKKRKASEAAKIKLIRQGFLTKKADIKETKALLEEYIKRYVPVHVQGRMLHKLSSVETKAQLLNAMEQADRIAARARKVIIRAKIRKLLKNVKPSVSGGKPLGKMDVKIYKKLRAYARYIDLHKKDNRLPVRELLREKGWDFEVFMKGFHGMDEGEVTVLYEELKALKEEGKTLKEQKTEKQKAELKTNVEAVLYIMGLAPDYDPSAKGLIDKTNFTKVSGILEKIMNNQYAWDNFIEKLHAPDKGSKYSGPLFKITDSIHKATTDREAGIKSYMEYLRDGLAKIYRITKPKVLYDKLQEMSSDLIDVGHHGSLSADQEIDGFELTRDQLIKIYNFKKDPLAIERLKTQNWTDERLAVVDKVLTEDDKAYADFLEEFYDNYYHVINTVYETVYNVPLGYNWRYTPWSIDKASLDEDIPHLLMPQYKKGSVSNNHMKMKKGTGGRLLYTGATNDLLKYVSQMEHFIHFAEPVLKLKKLFGNLTVRNAILAKHGGSLLKQLDWSIANFERGGADRAKANKYIDSIRNKFTVSVLGIKPSIGFKQVPSILAYATEMPFKDLALGVADFWDAPLANLEWLKANSPDLATRWGEGFSRDVKAAINKSKSTSSRIARNKDLNYWYLMNIGIGDKVATVQGAWAAYQYKLKETGSEDKAMAFAVALTKRTQPTHSIETLAPLQASGSLMKLATMFGNQPNKYLRIEAEAIRTLLGKGRGDKKQAAKNFALIHFILPAMFQFLADGLRFDKDRQIRALTLGHLNKFLAFGNMANSILSYIADKAQRKRGYRFQLSPVVSTVNDFFRLVDAITVLDVDRIIKQFIVVAGRISGTPTDQVIQILEADTPEELLHTKYALDHKDRDRSLIGDLWKKKSKKVPVGVGSVVSSKAKPAYSRRK